MTPNEQGAVVINAMGGSQLCANCAKYYRSGVTIGICSKSCLAEYVSLNDADRSIRHACWRYWLEHKDL